LELELELVRVRELAGRRRRREGRQWSGSGVAVAAAAGNMQHAQRRAEKRRDIGQIRGHRETGWSVRVACRGWESGIANSGRAVWFTRAVAPGYGHECLKGQGED
jgi:hypothetical protein